MPNVHAARGKAARPPASARGPRRKLQPQAGDAPGKEFVQGLDRGFAVVRAFTSARPRLTMAEVAEITGLTRAVARRYLFTLLKLGFVTREDTDFRLAPRIRQLGYAYLSTLAVPIVAQPFMRNLTAALHESCSMAVLDDSDIVYVARVSADRIMSVNLVVGSRLPAYATSMGKVLLAALPAAKLDRYLARTPLAPLTARTITSARALRAALRDIRERGWSLNDSELEEGVRSVAAPIVRDGAVVAALNVSVDAARVPLAELKRSHLPLLLRTAGDISRAL
jgi:IclR family pca regulon transcriptional regulator